MKIISCFKRTRLDDFLKALEGIRGNFDLLCAITGSSGCGKSELAKALLYYSYINQEEEGNLFCWRLEGIIRNEKMSYSEAFGNLLRKMEIEYKGPEDDQMAWMNSKTVLWRKLDRFRRWILVFDNADLYSSIEGYLPGQEARNGEIIVTTQNPQFFDLASSNFSIDKGLDQQDAIHLLEELSQISNNKEAQILTKRLDYSPMSIRTAGFYIQKENAALPKNQKLSYINYMDLIDDDEKLPEHKSILDSLGSAFYSQATGGAFKGSLRSSIRVSIRKVKPVFLSLLQHCAMIDSERIPRVLLVRLFRRITEEQSQMSSNTARFNHMFNKEVIGPETYSLLLPEGTLDEFYMHQSIQSETLRTIGDRDLLLKILKGVFEALWQEYPFDETTVASIRTNKEIAHHLNALLERMKEFRELAPQTIKILLRLEKLAEKLTDYSGEARYLKQIMDLITKFEIDDPMLRAEILSDRGLLKYRIYHFEDSVKDLIEAMQIVEKCDQGQKFLAGVIHNRLGWSMRRTQTNQALNSHKEAIQIHTKLRNDYEQEPRLKTDAYLRSLVIELGIGYNGMGLCFEQMGKYDNSIEHYKKALEIETAVLEEDHPVVGVVHNNIGSITLYERHKFPDVKLDIQSSLASLEKALRIRINNYGPSNSFVVMSDKNKARLYYYNDQPQRAIDILTSTIKMAIDVLGTHHLTLAELYIHMAEAWVKLGISTSTQEALQYYQKAYDVCTQNPEGHVREEHMKNINSGKASLTG